MLHMAMERMKKNVRGNHSVTTGFRAHSNSPQVNMF